MILGLDISTSKVGYAVINDTSQLVEFGVWKYKTSESLEIRAHSLSESLRFLRGKYGITHVFVEEPFIAFSGGRTTAVTMSKLQRFNGMCCYGVFRVFGDSATLVPSRQARANVGVKQKRGEDIKKKVIAKVQELYPQDFIVEMTRYGNPKPGTDDMADAIIVALAGKKILDNPI